MAAKRSVNRHSCWPSVWLLVDAAAQAGRRRLVRRCPERAALAFAVCAQNLAEGLEEGFACGGGFVPRCNGVHFKLLQVGTDAPEGGRPCRPARNLDQIRHGNAAAKRERVGLGGARGNTDEGGAKRVTPWRDDEVDQPHLGGGHSLAGGDEIGRVPRGGKRRQQDVVEAPQVVVVRVPRQQLAHDELVVDRQAIEGALNGRPDFGLGLRAFGKFGGRSSMVEPQPSKLMVRVRFPPPAPLF